MSPSSAPQPRSDAATGQRAVYQPDSAVQVVGDGTRSDAQRARLSPDERQAFGL